MLLSVSWVRCASCAPPPSSACMLGSPSEVAAAGTPDHKREEEHHSSDDQHKVQHTPLCMGGKGWRRDTWAVGGGGKTRITTKTVNQGKS